MHIHTDRATHTDTGTHTGRHRDMHACMQADILPDLLNAKHKQNAKRCLGKGLLTGVCLLKSCALRCPDLLSTTFSGYPDLLST